MRMTDFRPGWKVVGNDDHRIGTVKHIGQHYIQTSRPGFAADLYVPVDSIANVENETVHLNITQPDSDRMGWEQKPREDDDPGEAAESDLHRHI